METTTLTWWLTALLWLAVFIVFYTYLGYGILLYLLVKLKEAFRGKSSAFESAGLKEEYPDVTLVIAAYNEESIIPEKMLNCRALVYPKGKLRFLWVTDGSDDGSNVLLEQYPDVELVYSPERRGKTAALNHAMQSVRTPLVVFTDANTLLNQHAIRNLVRVFDNPKVGCAAGEKRICQDEFGSAVDGEGLYWKYESTLKTLDFRLYSAVGAAGELFAIRTRLFEPLPEDTLLDDFMLSMKIAAKGHRIAYCKDAFAEERPSFDMREESKRKVRISAGGIQSILRLLPLMNFFKYGILSFQYVSHRVLRWSLAPLSLFCLLPLNVLIVWLGSFDSGLYSTLLIMQIVFYILALWGFVLSKKQVRNRWLYVPYYFVFMNVSVCRGVRYLLTHRGSGVWAKAKRN
jgi:cellulose synthase/poly-beta-1,6-N-acetylglucosamine synthase-like glycosyltransferase